MSVNMVLAIIFVALAIIYALFIATLLWFAIRRITREIVEKIDYCISCIKAEREK